MWRSRQKSNPTVRRTFTNSFSFKDIESLCTSDPPIKNSNPSSPSQNPSISLKPPNNNNNNKPSIFHRVYRTNAVLRAFSSPRPESKPEPASAPSSSPRNAEFVQRDPSPISILGLEKRVVVYLTSLRVVRSTFEDCRTVQSILRGFRVTLDERDLSMDSSFMDELQMILNVREKTKLTLPRVFIGGRYIGGAEEIRQLNEIGELKKFMEGLPAAEPGVCEECGGYRFILCNECSGSHKCYTEKTSGFRSCTACNENGLNRCPSCSCAPISTV